MLERLVAQPSEKSGERWRVQRDSAAEWKGRILDPQFEVLSQRPRRKAWSEYANNPLQGKVRAVFNSAV